MTGAATIDHMTRRGYGTGTLRIKDGAWWGAWRTADGRRKWRKVGKAKTGGHGSGLTKKEASLVLQEMILTDNASAAARGDQPTVAQLGRVLLARLEQQGRKPSHIETVRSHLNAHIEPALGDLHADDVLDKDVRRLIDRMIQAGKQPKTVRNAIGTLHSVMEVARRDRMIDRNPVADVELPVRDREPEIRFLTQAELQRVLAAAPPEDVSRAERDWWPVLRLLVFTAALTGMRLGELRALRWQDLDTGAMKIRVRYSFVRGRTGTPKSRRSVRAIPLAKALLDELEEHHKTTAWNQDADLVLAHPHTGRPLDRVRLLVHFKAALVRANVRPVRIHDLRHTFATTMAATGDVSMRTLQEWMGHVDARTTAIYADYMPGEKEAEIVDKAFDRIVTKPSPMDADVL